MEWIKVTDRLPELKWQELIVYNGEDVITAIYYSHYFGFIDKENSDIPNVTHWMPLPEKPKE